MGRRVWCGALFAAVCLTGCAVSQKQAEESKKVHPVVLQAHFDLNCPRPEIGYLQMGPGQWGAVGCGRRARYKRVCRQRYTGNGGFGPTYKDECTWMLASPVMANPESEPQPASPGQSL